MSEQPYNPDDAAFLVSRSLDETLSADEQGRMDRALGSSRRLRDETKKLRAVDEVIRRWGSKTPELDWEHYTALVRARIENAETAQDLGRVDDLLTRWGRSNASVDADAFTESVLARVRRTESSTVRRPVFRVFAPLAVAAAIVLALTAGPWFAPPRKAVCRVVYGIPGQKPVGLSDQEPPVRGDERATGDGRQAAPGGEQARPRAVVSFDRTAVATAMKPSGGVGIAIGTVGSEPSTMVSGQGWPQ